MSTGASVIAFIAGCCVGAVLGWFTNEIRRARKTVDRAVEVMGSLDVTVTRALDEQPALVATHKAHRRRWWRWWQRRTQDGITREGMALLVVVVITAGSAFYAAGASSNANKAADQAAEAAAAVAKVTACNHRITTATLTALNQRSVYTDAQFLRSRALENAQARLIAKALAGTPVGGQPLQDYFDALSAKRVADINAAAKRLEFPFPDPSSIDECN